MNPGEAWVNAHLGYEHDCCLIWPFARNHDGYAVQIIVDGKHVYACRYMCSLVHGAPPSPKHIAAHSCGRGKDGCINPKHLSWKTPAENQLEGAMGKKRRPQAKLTGEQADEIRALKDKEPPLVTAERYGVYHTTIRLIQSGQTWRNGSRRTLSDEVIQTIRNTPATLVPSPAMAEHFGITPGVVQRIRSRKYYSYVPDDPNVIGLHASNDGERKP